MKSKSEASSVGVPNADTNLKTVTNIQKQKPSAPGAVQTTSAPTNVVAHQATLLTKGIVTLRTKAYPNGCWSSRDVPL